MTLFEIYFSSIVVNFKLWQNWCIIGSSMNYVTQVFWPILNTGYNIRPVVKKYCFVICRQPQSLSAIINLNSRDVVFATKQIFKHDIYNKAWGNNFKGQPYLEKLIFGFCYRNLFLDLFFKLLQHFDCQGDRLLRALFILRQFLLDSDEVWTWMKIILNLTIN